MITATSSHRAASRARDSYRFRTVCAVVAVLFLLPLLIAPLGASAKDEVVRFLPEQIAALSLTAVRPVAPALPPAVGFGLLRVYAAAVLAAGAWPSRPRAPPVAAPRAVRPGCARSRRWRPGPRP